MPYPEDADPDAVTEKAFNTGRLAPGEPDYHTVDYFDVQCGNVHVQIVMDMYHCSQDVPAVAPPGFTIVPPQ